MQRSPRHCNDGRPRRSRRRRRLRTAAGPSRSGMALLPPRAEKREERACRGRRRLRSAASSESHIGCRGHCSGPRLAGCWSGRYTLHGRQCRQCAASCGRLHCALGRPSPGAGGMAGLLRPKCWLWLAKRRPDRHRTRRPSRCPSRGRCRRSRGRVHPGRPTRTRCRQELAREAEFAPGLPLPAGCPPLGGVWCRIRGTSLR